MAKRLEDFSPIVFDRRRFPGKKCTGIISRETFLKLGVSKEYVDREFKDVRMVYGKKEIHFRVDVVRLNRERLEKDLSREVKYVPGTNAEVRSENSLVVNGQKYEGFVVRATGWDGKGRRVKAIEMVTEPIDGEEIVVYLDERNVGGFSWIVPLPDRTLVGALAYENPELFLPKVEKRVLERHGGTIPRCKPRYVNLGIGDVLCTVKTFTGGGIYAISELLDTFKPLLEGGDSTEYRKKLKALGREITRQYYLVRAVERAWKTSLKLGFSLLDGKTISVGREFDLHSSLLGRLLH